MFDETFNRQSGFFDEMAVDKVVLEEVSRIPVNEYIDKSFRPRCDTTKRRKAFFNPSDSPEHLL